MPDISFEILDAASGAEYQKWDALVDMSPVPDIYYRPGYARAYRDSSTQMTCALVVEALGFKALLPLLISGAGAGEDIHGRLRVAYSPYGYGGLLPLQDVSRPSAAQMAALRCAMKAFARDLGVVCFVLRLHPITGQDFWFKEDNVAGDVIFRDGNPTISLDLKLWNEHENCLGTLKKGRRSDLRFARRGLRTTWNCGWTPETLASLVTFQAIYNARMRALGAGDFYHFSPDYYSTLAAELRDRLAVGLAQVDGVPVGGALFMADARWAHYHLSAANAIGNDFKATTLLINEGASWARQRGCGQLHLGGGVSGQDTLFQFKQSFGGSVLHYGTATVIADPLAFRSLCEKPDAGWPFTMHRAVHEELHRPPETICSGPSCW